LIDGGHFLIATLLYRWRTVQCFPQNMQCFVKNALNMKICKICKTILTLYPADNVDFYSSKLAVRRPIVMYG